MSEEKEEQILEFEGIDYRKDYTNEVPKRIIGEFVNEVPEEIKPVVEAGVYKCPKPKDRSVEPLEFVFREGDDVEISGVKFVVESRNGEKMVLKRVDFK